ncbi:hypothetical protein AN958_09790 [Leucoagaricus sp. SymC.cos]|nr:hypothetical protein AN958_09790 [Leucoagaricus sp. SymC.cos]
MMRVFLAIPATSVSVDCTFSKSQHICTDLQSALKAEMISGALLSKVWILDELLDVNKPSGVGCRVKVRSFLHYVIYLCNLQ